MTGFGVFPPAAGLVCPHGRRPVESCEFCDPGPPAWAVDEDGFPF